jgi:hypothetical protein
MYPPKATHHQSSSLIFWPPATIAHLAATVGLPPNLSPHIPSGSSSTFPYAGYSYFYCCAGTKCAPRQRLGRTQKLQRVQNTPNSLFVFLISSLVCFSHRHLLFYSVLNFLSLFWETSKVSSIFLSLHSPHAQDPQAGYPRLVIMHSTNLFFPRRTNKRLLIDLCTTF